MRGLTGIPAPKSCAFGLIPTVLTSPLLAAGDNNELPFKATSIITETTDHDLELQAFVDGGHMKSLQISDVRERTIFYINTRRELGPQELSELTFASEPDHLPENALDQTKKPSKSSETFWPNSRQEPTNSKE